MKIPEELLHYVWRFRLYNQFGLKTVCGKSIEVLDAGLLNRDAGPDFSMAKIRLDHDIWVGDVELHVQSKDWYLHRHEQDERYRTVILHVVWDGYHPVKHSADEEIPTLMLQDIVDPDILQQYIQLQESSDIVPCTHRLPDVSALHKVKLLERMCIERLTHRYAHVQDLLSQHGDNWERITFILLSRAMGMRVNKEVFVRFAENFPINLLSKYSENPRKMNALLFGQAGMLSSSSVDAYHDELSKEYTYLRDLHKLAAMAPYEWRYMRMRPDNFPTVRLAQLSAIYEAVPFLFSWILTCETVSDFRERLCSVSIDGYWNTHNRFGNTCVYRSRNLSKDFVVHLTINVAVLVLFSYGTYMQYTAFVERSISWLEALQSEKNAVVKLFDRIGLSSNCAADSQAMLHLKSEYCDQKKCLDCTVGLQLFKPSRS